MNITIDETTNNVTVADTVVFSPTTILAANNPASYYRRFTDGFTSTVESGFAIAFDEWRALAGAGTNVNSTGGLSEPDSPDPSCYTGVINIGTSGGVANAGYSLQSRVTINNDIPIGSERVSIRARVNLAPQNSDITDIANIRTGVGFVASPTSTPNNAILWRWGTLQGSTTANSWHCTIINSGTVTNYDSTITAIEAWRDLRIEVNADASEAVFKNGETVVHTVTSGIPVVYMTAIAYFLTNNTNAGSGRMFIDYLLLERFVSR